MPISENVLPFPHYLLHLDHGNVVNLMISPKMWIIFYWTSLWLVFGELDYYRITITCEKTGAACGAGDAYSSGSLTSLPVFQLINVINMFRFCFLFLHSGYGFCSNMIYYFVHTLVFLSVISLQRNLKVLEMYYFLKKTYNIKFIRFTF